MNPHPIRLMFRMKCVSDAEGMNKLQETGQISDLCVSIDDIAPADVQRVLGRRQAHSCWTPPPWRRE